MKKLKAALILLLALMMSLCLFACGGGEEEPPTGGGENPPPQGEDPTPPGGGEDDESGYRKIELDPAIIRLTDSDEQAKLDQALAEVTVYATDYEGEEYEFQLSDCDYNVNVTLHEVGEYSFDVALKSDDSVKATLTVAIDHNWKTESETTQVCQYEKCKARRVTQDENVIIHYGTFHEGTKAVLPSGYWDETTVYTNKMADTSIVKPFGQTVDGYEVPTLTAGQLEPGMTITIKGRAMTTSGETGPWGTENKNWNSPTIGIADRYNMYQNPANLTEYKGGVSVLVRQEGWVLYNGIGDTDATNRLGGIIGGKGENAGGWKNFGSHDEASADTTPGTGQTGYVPGVIPTDWSNIGDWWVYSTGATFPSLLNYAYQTTEDGKPDISNATEYEYSWNYREDGVIEITYNYIVGTTVSTLKSYIKVPDSSVGYYDTIIHGDYNDMTITKSIVTTKRTPTEFRYNGLKSGANSVYAENKPFDAATLNVEVKYEQTGDVWNTLQVSNSQVYYYNGTLSREELGQADNKAVLDATDSEKWTCLGSNNALKAGAIYKIHIVKGGKTFVQLLPANAFEVLPNKVASAEGADVTVNEVLFANNGKLGGFDFSVADRKILLTLDGGYVQTLNGDQKTKLGANTETKYVALRLNGAALGTAFSDANVTVKKDGTTEVSSKAVVVDNDLYLAIALSEGGKYTVSGAQTTEIVLDLTKLKGFNLTSKVEGNLVLNKGGELTLTYTVPAGTTKDQLTISVNGSPYDLSYDVGKDGEDLGLFKLLSATLDGTTLTATVKAPAADLSNYASVRIELSLKGDKADSIVDVVDYDMNLSDAEGYIAGENGAYAFVQKSGMLSVVTAFDNDELANGVISGRFTLNVNNGNLDTFKKYGLLTIDYTVVDGVLSLLGAPSYATGYVKLLGTYGDNRDTDKGAFVVINIDVNALEITGDYYFNFVTGHFNAQQAPAKILKVSGTKISEETVSGNSEIISTAAGSCYEEGLYAWAVKSGDKVIFYADAAAAGGEHVDADNNGKCDLCGGTITKDVVMKDWDDGYTGAQYTVTEGTIIDVAGSINESGLSDKGGNMGPFVSILMSNGKGGNKRYWLRTDGWMVCHPTDGWANDAAVDEGPGNVEANNTPVLDENFYTSLAYNTLNGAVLTDGSTLNTGLLNEFLAGKSFRYIASYIGTTIKVEFNYYDTDGVLALSYYAEIRNVTEKSITVQFISDDVTFLQNSGKITVTQASAANSVIESVVSAEVSGHDAPTTIEYADPAREGSEIVLALSGIAAKDSSYYASFKINFSQALVSTASVKLVNAEGNAIDGAVCTLAGDRTYVDVYLPIANGLKVAYIRFSNYEASTAQADIKVDLNDLVVSDITASVSDLSGLNIGEGAFTVTYTGAVQDTDTLVIGGVSKAISELKAAAVSYGNGYSAQAAVTADSTTVTITKAAADLTKVVEGVEIRLERAGALLATNTIAPALTVHGGTELNESGWYATANGTQLILFSNSNGDLYLSVNAGQATDTELVNIYNLTVQDKGGFAESNALTKVSKSVYSENGGTKLYVIVIELATLGVTEDTAYGYQAYLNGTEAQNYYTVSAGTISAATAPVTESKQPETLVEGNCMVSGVTAYATEGKTFYYNITKTAASGHEWVEKSDADKKGYDKVYECSNECGTLKYEQNSDETAISSSWGQKNANGNAYLGWTEGLNWETFGILHKGGSYEITGVNLSNEGEVWHLPEPGLTDTKGSNADGFRIDNYVQNDNATLPWDNEKAGVVYNFNDAKNPSFSYTFDNLVSAVKTHLNNATITYKFDYTNADKIVITMHLVNGSDLDFTVTVTLTGELADSYYLAFHADGNLYTASKVETVVPAEKEVPAALSKHQHDWSKSDKCECGAIHPEHGISEDHPHVKGEDDVHCSVCGAVMEHEHSYNSYYVCEYCGVADNTSIAAMEVTDANLGTGAFGGTGDWWGCASADLTIGAADFLVKITFSQGTSAGITGALEVIYTAPGSHGNGYLTYNPNDSGHWGGMIEGEGAAKATLYAFGTKPTTLTNVTYEVYVWRIGTTMVVDYRVLDNAELAWEQVVVVENVEAQALNIHINGYTNGYTNLKGYTGSITAKA